MEDLDFWSPNVNTAAIHAGHETTRPAADCFRVISTSKYFADVIAR